MTAAILAHKHGRRWVFRPTFAYDRKGLTF